MSGGASNTNNRLVSSKFRVTIGASHHPPTDDGSVRATLFAGAQQPNSGSTPQTNNNNNNNNNNFLLAALSHTHASNNSVLPMTPLPLQGTGQEVASHQQPFGVQLPHATLNATSNPPAAPRYGGAIVRVSELRQQGVTLPVESVIRPKSKRSRADTADALALASTSTPRIEFHAAGSSAFENPSSTRRKPTPKASSRKSRASSSLPLDESGRPFEHRWFTAGGRRQLVYNGKTYKGTKAHTMWRQLKSATQRVATTPAATARAAAANRGSSATNGVPQRTRRPAGKSSRRTAAASHQVVVARSPVTSEYVDLSAFQPVELPSSQQSGLSQQWAELYEQVGIHPTTNGGSGYSRGATLTAATPPAAAVPPPRSIPRKLPARQVPGGLSLLDLPRTGPTASPPSSSLMRPPLRAPQPEVIEIISDDEVEEQTIKKEMPTTTKGDIAFPRAVPEWPVSYFDSETDDEDDKEQSSSQLGQLLEQGAVVERDGWLYPADLSEGEEAGEAAAYSSAGQKQETKTSHIKIKAESSFVKEEVHTEDEDDIPLAARFGTQWGSSVPACSPLAAMTHHDQSGLSVIGLPRAPRPAPPLVSMPQNRTVPPSMDRYEGPSGFEGLDAQDLEGMFELGEEIGGFRY